MNDFYSKIPELIKQPSRRALAEYICIHLIKVLKISSNSFIENILHIKANINFDLKDFIVNTSENNKEYIFKFATESINDNIAEVFCFSIKKNDYLENASFKIEFDLFISLVTASLSWHQKVRNSYSLALTDELTGLYNYRFLCQAVDFEIIRAQRFKSKFSILFIDLDLFKSINDQYGHLTGSSIIKQTAQVIQQSVRATDIATRYGGDEFVILALATDLKGAQILAQRIRSNIENHKFITLNQNTVSLTASIGIASYPLNADKRSNLLMLADKAMYQSKNMGKNTISVFDQNLEMGANYERTAIHETP